MTSSFAIGSGIRKSMMNPKDFHRSTLAQTVQIYYEQLRKLETTFDEISENEKEISKELTTNLLEQIKTLKMIKQGADLLDDKDLLKTIKEVKKDKQNILKNQQQILDNILVKQTENLNLTNKNVSSSSSSSSSSSILLLNNENVNHDNNAATTTSTTTTINNNTFLKSFAQNSLQSLSDSFK
jgi:hypothetical protein